MEDDGRMKKIDTQAAKVIQTQSGSRWAEKKKRWRERVEEDEKEVTICIIQTH